MRLRTAVGAAAIAAAALTISACNINGDGPVLTRDDLSGETTTQSRELDGFTQIDMGGSADLLVMEGASFEIEVTSDSALQEHVTTEVVGNTLRIEQHYSIIGASPSVAVSGAGGIEGEDMTIADATVSVSGAGSVKVRVRHSLDAHVSGAGTIVYYGCLLYTSPSPRD